MDALLTRMREHAELHDNLARNGADDEQRQWGDDLRTAADEIERLRKALRYEQHILSREGTHGPDCATWGPAHYECAMREIERLRAERDESAQIKCLVDIRWAVGDNGVRMQDELVEYIREIVAERDKLRGRIEKSAVADAGATFRALGLPCGHGWDGKSLRLVVEEG